MQKDLLQRINEHKASFSKGQRAISAYIMENYDKAAFMTAAKLGATVGVSESTVVRFASILGFDGYPGLQGALQELIKNKLTAVQRLEVAVSRFGEDTLSRVIHSDIENLRHTLEQTSEPAFRKAVEAVANARHIYIIGARSAGSLAQFLSYNLNLAFNNVRSVQTASTSEMLEQLMMIGEQDLLIGISFPRYSRKTVKAFEFASDRGANTVAITDSQASPIAQMANILLTARSNMVSYVDSLVAPLSLINALVVAASLEREESVRETLNELETIWERYDIYEKIGDQADA